MEKKTISVHAFTVHLYTIAIAVLLLALILLGLKYVHLKWSVNHYTNAAIWQQLNQTPSASVSDFAGVIATTVGQYPQDKAFYTQPVLLESYITAVAKQTKRRFVVVDTTKKILADSVVGNMGSKYDLDQENEIGKTMQDGMVRSFTETSKDYPAGLSEVVVPLKNDKGQIIGAVVVSNSTVSQ